jgi:hypothetical protein
LLVLALNRSLIKAQQYNHFSLQVSSNNVWEEICHQLPEDMGYRLDAICLAGKEKFRTIFQAAQVTIANSLTTLLLSKTSAPLQLQFV